MMIRYLLKKLNRVVKRYMKHEIELLKADIRDELLNLEKINIEFIAIENKFNYNQMPAYDCGAIGYILHSFYNGCENIFRSIARFFENDLSEESWHTDVLKRMKLEIPGYRPQVITEELFGLLDDFRAFRHKFRHSYSFNLDWEKEALVARKFRRTYELLLLQISDFLQEIDVIDVE